MLLKGVFIKLFKLTLTRISVGTIRRMHRFLVLLFCCYSKAVSEDVSNDEMTLLANFLFGCISNL